MAAGMGPMATREMVNLQRRIAQLEKTVERITQVETKPRLILSDTSKGKIAYTVTAAAVVSDTDDQFDGLMKLTVTVEWAGQPNLVTTSVTVYDWSPCLATAETPAALVGRWGWAAWGVGEDQSAAAEAGDLTEFHWGCDGLCCP